MATTTKSKSKYEQGKHPHSLANLQPREPVKGGCGARSFRISDTLGAVLERIGHRDYGRPIDIIESMTDLLEMLPYLLFTLELCYSVLEDSEEAQQVEEVIEELRILPILKVIRTGGVYMDRGDCLMCENTGVNILNNQIPCPVCKHHDTPH